MPSVRRLDLAEEGKVCRQGVRIPDDYSDQCRSLPLPQLPVGSSFTEGVSQVLHLAVFFRASRVSWRCLFQGTLSIIIAFTLIRIKITVEPRRRNQVLEIKERRDVKAALDFVKGTCQLIPPLLLVNLRKYLDVRCTSNTVHARVSV